MHYGDIYLRVTLLRSFSLHVFSKRSDYLIESAAYNSIQARKSTNGTI